MSTRHKAIIHVPGPTGKDAEIWLDKTKILGVTSFEVSIGFGSPNRVKIELYVDQITGTVGELELTGAVEK